MSTVTGIKWTDHTFNPWWGCTKVHAGCANCYAESLDHRWGGNHWGKDSPRRMVLGEWSKPKQWNAAAQAAGKPAFVFCASMSDLFEDYSGPVVDQRGLPVPMRDQVGNWTVPRLRRRVFNLIEQTPWLIWQLLTKRPENVPAMVPAHWIGSWPSNVMVGTSPCNQKTSHPAIYDLLKIPGPLFLSCEPLLGTLDLGLDAFIEHTRVRTHERIRWVIVGAESNGKNAGRYADGYAHSARHILAQCRENGVRFFNKQMPVGGKISHDPSEWPEDLRVQEMPEGSHK